MLEHFYIFPQGGMNMCYKKKSEQIPRKSVVDFRTPKNKQVYFFHFAGSLEKTTKYNLGGNKIFDQFMRTMEEVLDRKEQSNEKAIDKTFNEISQ